MPSTWRKAAKNFACAFHANFGCDLSFWNSMSLRDLSPPKWTRFSLLIWGNSSQTRLQSVPQQVPPPITFNDNFQSNEERIRYERSFVKRYLHHQNGRFHWIQIFVLGNVWVVRVDALLNHPTSCIWEPPQGSLLKCYPGECEWGGGRFMSHRGN